MVTASIAKKFSGAARTYRAEAGVQRRVVDELTRHLVATQSPTSILELGCGTGELTGKLVQAFPAASITALDVAEGMVKEAREKIKADNIEWVVADARTYRPEANFPLIVSSSALHWMPPLGQTLQHLSRLLVKKGELVAALMVQGTLAKLAAARETVAPKKAPSVKMPSVSEVIAAIEGAGLELTYQEVRGYSEEYPSVEAMLRSLRDQGVTGYATSDAKPLSKAEVFALKCDYERRCPGNPRRITADYHVLYVHCSRK